MLQSFFQNQHHLVKVDSFVHYFPYQLESLLILVFEHLLIQKEDDSYKMS